MYDLTVLWFGFGDEDSSPSALIPRALALEICQVQFRGVCLPLAEIPFTHLWGSKMRWRQLNIKEYKYSYSPCYRTRI